MAFIPVPNVCMFELRFTLDGQKVENTLYGHKNDGWLSSEAQNVGDKLFTWWVDNMAPFLSNRIALDSVHCTDLSSSTGFVTDFVPEESAVGELDTAALPNNVAICISFRSTARGRTGRGRNYVCGFPDNSMVGSTLNTDVGIALVAAYNLIQTAMSEESAVWVIVSRFVDLAPREEGISRTVSSIILVDLVGDSQRRRLPGRGT